LQRREDAKMTWRLGERNGLVDGNANPAEETVLLLPGNGARAELDQPDIVFQEETRNVVLLTCPSCSWTEEKERKR